MFDIKNITMIYDMEKTEKVYAMKGFDLKLPDKGLVGIIGPSGSGKSTLMYCLSTLKKPTDGKIFYNGKDLTNLKEKETGAFAERRVWLCIPKTFSSAVYVST